VADSVIDACCIINLSAIDELSSVLPHLEMTWYVPSVVVAESLFLRGADRKGLEPIDLTPAIDAQMLRICDLQDDRDTELYVELAAQIDDGEATCLAIAKNREWMLATDDRKALRLARELDVATVTTPELVKRWADRTGVSTGRLLAALTDIRERASFIPRSDSPHYSWWMEHLNRQT
jgi:predicted nucleic acid-binding protein